MREAVLTLRSKTEFLNKAVVIPKTNEIGTAIMAVMEARNNIIAQARKLQDAGEIIMSAGDSADYL